jgi:hypothetical protein
MDLTPIALLTALALSLTLAMALAWWLGRGFARRRIRLVARIVLFLVFAALFSKPLTTAVTEPIDEGRWLCLLCGDQERQTRYAGLVLERSRTAHPRVHRLRALVRARDRPRS